MERIDTVVIGAGVVGLAAAAALARDGREVVVLEAAGAIGTETSSRNSEVIHAGLYYATDSLKAELCVRGKAMLYERCAARGIAHRRCGKLIVSTAPEQDGKLGSLLAQARANGVDDVAPVSAAQARGMEPALRCTAALWSPSTGIVDSHGLMLSLRGEAEDFGAMFAFHAPVEGGELRPDGIALRVGGAEPMRVLARRVVNAAGLHAQALAAAIDGVPTESVPGSGWCKGNYYALAGRAPFTRLVYPVPEAAGLGVHLTLDLAGQARFGPDVEWIDRLDYAVDPARSRGFHAAIRRYWPDLPEDSLVPAYAGIRPKLGGPDAPAADFRIDGPAAHGVPGLVQLFGIESPGLTASLAIGERVRALLAD